MTKEWRSVQKSVLLLQGSNARAEIVELRKLLEGEHLTVVVCHTGCAAIRELTDRAERTLRDPQFTAVIIDWGFVDGSYRNGVMLLEAIRKRPVIGDVHVIMTDRNPSEAKRSALAPYKLLGYHRPSRGAMIESLSEALRR